MKFLLILTLALSNYAYADEATCRNVLKKCDEALRAEIELNTKLNEIVKDQNNLIQLQDEKIESQSIWKTIAIGAGVVVGIETLILVLRK